MALARLFVILLLFSVEDFALCQEFRIPSSAAAQNGIPYAPEEVLPDGSMQIVAPRPFNELAGLIERRWGIPVNYEDAQWSLADSEDIAPRLKASRPVMVPRSSTIRFPGIRYEGGAIQKGMLRMLSLPELNALADRASELAKSAIESQSLAPADGRSAVQPVFIAIRSSRGLLLQASPSSIAKSPPLLDRRIALKVTGSGYDFTNEFCKQLTAVAGVTVVPGTVPTSLLGNGHVSLDLSGTARDILAEGLGQLEGSPTAGGLYLAWKLLYGAQENTYVLNLNIVATEEDLPLGGKVWRIVQREN